MGPIDYSSAFSGESPLQAFTQSLGQGIGIQQAQAQQAQKQAELAQRQQLSADLQEYSKNPTTQGIAQLSVKYPQLSEQFKRSYDMLAPDQQQAKLSAALPVYAAAMSGRHDIAASSLRDTAKAMENAGNTDEAKRTLAMADLFEQHPETATRTAGLLLASVLGPDKFSTTFGALGKEGREEAASPAELSTKQSEARIKAAEAGAAPEKVAADIANVKSQIADRAKRLALDTDKLTTETQVKLTELKQKFGEIPEFVAKDINAASADAVAAKQSAERMTGLADKLEAEGGGYGGLSTAGEWIKRATGNQNEMSRLRSEYNRIVTPAAMAAYKKVASGSTSDKDIETAMIGVPKDNADASIMASFLRGVSKLQSYDAEANNAKVEWLGANKNLGKSKTDMEIDGVKVPAGTSFNKFAEDYVTQKVERLNAAQVLESLNKKYGSTGSY